MSQLMDQVQEKYGAVARSTLGNDHPGVRAVAEAFGYSADELAVLPAEANIGLSCGNPTATAHLRPGEVVVDLGCGGGLDVLLASLKVGPEGKAIGIDMTPDMIARAEQSAVKFGNGAAPANVEFRLGRIERLPLEDNSVDCLISNCVINLVPDKAAAFREMLRVLKPGGRLALSDIALKRTLPADLAASVSAYVGCIAGAITIDFYEQLLREAGFSAVQVVDSHKDLNAYAKLENSGGCCGGGPDSVCGDSASASTQLTAELSDLLKKYQVNDFAASVRVFAVKSQDKANQLQNEETTTMTTLQVYDPPMCCSTGVCGPAVDPKLAQFAADLEWLKSQGVQLQRFNLGHEPGAFTACAEVKAALQAENTACLPLIRCNERVVSKGVYPSRAQMASWCGVAFTDTLPVVSACCEPGSGCC